MWSTHMMEYYLALKRNEALIIATKWFNLRNILERERNQTHVRSHSIYFYEYEISRTGKSLGPEAVL